MIILALALISFRDFLDERLWEPLFSPWQYKIKEPKTLFNLLLLTLHKWHILESCGPLASPRIWPLIHQSLSLEYCLSLPSHWLPHSNSERTHAYSVHWSPQFLPPLFYEGTYCWIRNRVRESVGSVSGERRVLGKYDRPGNRLARKLPS